MNMVDICPTCGRPAPGSITPVSAGRPCTPLTSPECWTTTHRWSHDKRSWEPVLRVVPNERTDA